MTAALLNLAPVVAVLLAVVALAGTLALSTERGINLLADGLQRKAAQRRKAEDKREQGEATHAAL